MIIVTLKTMLLKESIERCKFNHLTEAIRLHATVKLIDAIEREISFVKTSMVLKGP